MSDPLALRRGRVVEAGSEPHGSEPQELVVEVGDERREALSFTGLTGACATGDEVVVNIAARELGLGSGGFDVVLVNLSSGVAAPVAEGPHAMKLNYSPLQHAVEPIERSAIEPQNGGPVAALALHGQLAPVAWAFAQARPGARLGFVQTPGGALPGALSQTVRELRARELLCDHVTAGPCFGGEREAITLAGALDAGFSELGWDAAVAGPGPGILGTDTALGHGGLAALDTLHTALALGCQAVCVPRMSSGDERPRHQGLSHHTRTVLDLVLRPVLVAWPGDQAGAAGLPAGAALRAVEGAPPVAAGVGAAPELRAIAAQRGHQVRDGRGDLEGYRASGLPATAMGRALDDDELFFAAALAGGDVLAAMIEG